jgi:hypothetical protein
MPVVFMILQKWTFDAKFQIFLSTLLKLTTEIRLDYSGNKIIQIFIVTNRFNHSWSRRI